LGFGLSARLDPAAHEPLRNAVLDARREFEDKYVNDEIGNIEIYDARKYLYHASVAENLLFGSAVDNRFSVKELPRNPLFIRFLEQTDLLEPLTALGLRFAIRITETTDDQGPLPPNLPITRKALESLLRGTDTEAAVQRPPKRLEKRDQRRFLNLALHYVPAFHEPAGLSESLARRLVEGRIGLKKRLESEAPEAVRGYDPNRYIPEATIQENIIFGRITTERSAAKTRITKMINRLLVETELLEAIIEIGMEFEVGRGGENLSGGQRQKLALARALLKKPPILLLDEATSNLDNRSQDRVQKVLESRWKGHSTLVAVVHRLDIIKNYDKIAVMKAGRIEELGTYEELLEKKGLLYQLADK
jgi:energy-coupling factor transporter ATP-binding protein EcfA2